LVLNKTARAEYQRRPYHVDHTSSRPIAEVKQP
jgi:hypothetical protein